jgi:hypothetical protein
MPFAVAEVEPIEHPLPAPITLLVDEEVEDRALDRQRAPERPTLDPALRHRLVLAVGDEPVDVVGGDREVEHQIRPALAPGAKAAVEVPLPEGDEALHLLGEGDRYGSVRARLAARLHLPGRAGSLPCADGLRGSAPCGRPALPR